VPFLRFGSALYSTCDDGPRRCGAASEAPDWPDVSASPDLVPAILGANWHYWPTLRYRRWLAPLCGLGLLASACTGSSPTGESASSTSAPPTSSTTSTTTPVQAAASADASQACLTYESTGTALFAIPTELLLANAASQGKEAAKQDSHWSQFASALQEIAGLPETGNTPAQQAQYTQDNHQVTGICSGLTSPAERVASSFLDCLYTWSSTEYSPSPPGPDPTIIQKRCSPYVSSGLDTQLHGVLAAPTTSADSTDWQPISPFLTLLDTQKPSATYAPFGFVIPVVQTESLQVASQANIHESGEVLVNETPQGWRVTGIYARGASSLSYTGSAADAFFAGSDPSYRGSSILGLPSVAIAGWTGLEPRTIYFSADAGNIATALNWSSWTDTEAVGHGVREELSCVPSCAQGTSVAYPVTIMLSKPTNGGFSLITEVTEDQRGTTESFSSPYLGQGACSTASANECVFTGP